MNNIIKPPHHDGMDANEIRKADAAYKMLLHGRRHYGRPAASLTQLDNPVLHGKLPKGWKRAVLDKARQGEETTSAMLLSWMQDKPDVVLFDSIHIKNGETDVDMETGLLDDNGDTDHIIICGTHVLIIDSKAWKGGWKKKSDPINKKTGNRPLHDSVYWINWKGHVVRFNKDFPGGKVHMGSAIRLWKSYLHTLDGNVNIEGMIHIVNDKVIVSSSELGLEKARQDANYAKYAELSIAQANKVYHRQGWRLVEKRMFLKSLDAWYQNIKQSDRFISTDLVALIATQCCKPYDPSRGLINKSLLYSTASNENSIQDDSDGAGNVKNDDDEPDVPALDSEDDTGSNDVKRSSWFWKLFGK